MTACSRSGIQLCCSCMWCTGYVISIYWYRPWRTPSRVRQQSTQGVNIINVYLIFTFKGFWLQKSFELGIWLPLWNVICISVSIMIHHEKIWRLLKHFFLRCISLHIVINYEVSGYIEKDPEGYWNSFDLSWCIMINYDISQSPMGKSFRVSWRITICHDLHHNISER